MVLSDMPPKEPFQKKKVIDIDIDNKYYYIESNMKIEIIKVFGNEISPYIEFVSNEFSKVKGSNYLDTLDFKNNDTINVGTFLNEKNILITADNNNPNVIFVFPEGASETDIIVPDGAPPPSNTIVFSTENCGVGNYSFTYEKDDVWYSISFNLDFRPDIPETIDINDGPKNLIVPYSSLYSDIIRVKIIDGEMVEQATGNTYTFNSGDEGQWVLVTKVNNSSSVLVKTYFTVGDNTTNNDEQEDNYINVYPNPTFGPMTIEGLENMSGVELQIYSNNGKLVKNIQNFKGFVDMSYLSQGSYNLYILLPEKGKNKGRVVKKKVIKKVIKK